MLVDKCISKIESSLPGVKLIAHTNSKVPFEGFVVVGGRRFHKGKSLATQKDC